MWSKLYFAVLAVAILVMAFFTYYSWSWLQSIGQPTAAAEGYVYHSGLAWTVLWVSSIILILLANAVMWASGKSWAVWITLAYLAVFIIIRYFWLGQAFFEFTTSNGMTDKMFSFSRLSGVIVLAVAAVIVYIDQFVIVKLWTKTYGHPAVAIAPPIDKIEDSE